MQEDGVYLRECVVGSFFLRICIGPVINFLPGEIGMGWWASSGILVLAFRSKVLVVPLVSDLSSDLGQLFWANQHVSNAFLSFQLVWNHSMLPWQHYEVVVQMSTNSLNHKII